MPNSISQQPTAANVHGIRIPEGNQTCLQLSNVVASQSRKTQNRQMSHWRSSLLANRKSLSASTVVTATNHLRNPFKLVIPTLSSRKLMRAAERVISDALHVTTKDQRSPHHGDGVSEYTLRANHFADNDGHRLSAMAVENISSGSRHTISCTMSERRGKHMLDLAVSPILGTPPLRSPFG